VTDKEPSFVVAPRTPPGHRLIYLVLVIGTSTFSLLQSVVSPILPVLATSLHTSETNVTWALTAYLLAASVFTPILGRLGDVWGKRRVLAIILALLAVGSVLSAMAGSLGMMIAGRTIQGVGGGVIPLSFGIIRDQFPEQRVAGAVTFISALLSVGGGVGLVVAGPVVDLLSYRWLFLIPGVVVAGAAVATLAIVPESQRREGDRVSWPAAALLSGWLVALLLALSEGPQWGWRSPRVAALLLIAVVLAGTWISAERRSRHPLIDPRLIAAPAMWTMNLVALLFGMSLYAVFAFVPAFLQAPSGAGYGFHSTVTQSGLIVLPMSLTSFAGSAVTGWLSRRIGAKATVTAGLALGAPPFFFAAFAHGHIWEVMVTLAILGAANGLVFASIAAVVVEAAPAHQTGVASGVNANIRTIGGAIGTAALASVIAVGIRPGGLPRESGYIIAFAVLAVSRLVAAAAGLLVPVGRHVGDEGIAESVVRELPEHSRDPQV
jgi:EmrB/QacA subfamily drug resistance transporter